MEFLQQIWQWLLGFGPELWVVASIVAILGGFGLIWAVIRWIRKEDIGTTAKTILKTQRSAEERAEEDRERLKRIEKQSEETLKLVLARLEAREAAQPRGGTPEAREAEAGIEKDIGAAIATLAEAGKTAALEALGRGDTAAADTALAAKIAEIEKARGRAAKEEAALYRQRGALAYLNEPLAALPLYAKAAELDPDDPEGWNRLGILQRRTGAFDAAIRSFETVLRLGNRLQDRSIEAAANGNLGVIFAARRDLDQGKLFHSKALEIDEALSNKERIAIHIGNLGIVFFERGDMNQAGVSFRKALELDRTLCNTEGVAQRWRTPSSSATKKGKRTSMHALAVSIAEEASRIRPRPLTAKPSNSMRSPAVSAKAWGSPSAIWVSFIKKMAIQRRLARIGGRETFGGTSATRARSRDMTAGSARRAAWSDAGACTAGMTQPALRRTKRFPWPARSRVNGLPDQSKWETRPSASLGSNHVDLGGITSPASATAISCAMEVA